MGDWSLKRITFLGVLLSYGLSANCQTRLDSLFKLAAPHVGVFVDYKTKNYPTATPASWFYYRPDTSNQFYIVTAKHVLLGHQAISESSSISHGRMHLMAKDAYGSQLSFTFESKSMALGFHPDSLIDVYLQTVFIRAGFTTEWYTGRGFGNTDIVSKSEVDSLKNGTEVFFVGLNRGTLDSTTWRSAVPIFRIAIGNVFAVYQPAVILSDEVTGQRVKIELILTIGSEPGNSGSPVMLVTKDQVTGQQRLRLLGIINAGFVRGPYIGKVACTLSYHLMEYQPPQTE